MPRRPFALLLATLLCVTAACGDDEPSSQPGPTADTGGEDVAPDAPEDTGGEDAPEDTGGEDADAEEDAQPDAAPDVAPDVEPDAPVAPTLEFAVRVPFDTRPADPLAGAPVQSCGLFLEERCEGGALRRCDVYDTGSGSFTEAPEPLLRRALLYDRWYDLHHSPDGVTADRLLTEPVAPGAPESEWASRARFAEYRGMGDGAIWTGAALNAQLMRYLSTGTEADYARMEQKTRDLLLLFRVTGMDGYLARHPFLLVPPGSGTTPDHIILHGDGPRDHRDNPIVNPGQVEGLSSIYTQGFVNERGETITGAAMWQGNPSIDQYTGATVALPAVWGVLRDEALKAEIVQHMTCYLKRLEHLQVTNLQQNPAILESLQTFFAGGGVETEPGDIDFFALDTIDAWVLPQYHNRNTASWRRECPATLDLTPTRVIDATSNTFYNDLLDLVSDAQNSDGTRARAIAHFYVPSVRGGDAMHLMHLAAMAWLWTGDATYRSFLEDELLGRVRTAEVADTMYGFTEPYACRKFFGNHITYSPLWAFINLLDASPLKTHMQTVMHEEAWLRDNQDLANAKFNLMYAAVVPAAIGTGRQRALDEALALIRDYGGNHDTERALDEPRRTWLRDFDTVVAQLPPGIQAVCPDEAERARCETPLVLFGVPVQTPKITRPCTGASSECPMSTGECATKRASAPLPMRSRTWADFMWQRSPFQLIERTWEDGGRRQSPGVDMMEAYWLARYYGFLREGEGQVLAWREIGGCN